MIIIWKRRNRTPIWKRIVRMALMVGSAVGATVGAELLRRKLGIRVPSVEVTRDGRGTRMRVSLRTKRAGRRGRRTVVSASRS